jgi:nucleoside-diphosphate-sugar epimerase
VHRLDAARLYRLALEKGVGDERYHVIADEGVPVGDIAHVIGRRLDVPVAAKAATEASSHFGWIGQFTAMDCPASSQRTRDLLAWQPTQAGLIADLDRTSYFAV